MDMIGFKTLLLYVGQDSLKCAVSNDRELITDITNIGLPRSPYNHRKGTLETDNEYVLTSSLTSIRLKYQADRISNIKKAVVNVPTLGTAADISLLTKLLTADYRKPYLIHTNEALAYAFGKPTALIIEAGSQFSCLSAVINYESASIHATHHLGYQGLKERQQSLGDSVKKTLRSKQRSIELSLNKKSESDPGYHDQKMVLEWLNNDGESLEYGLREVLIGDLFEDVNGFPNMIKGIAKQFSPEQRKDLLENIIVVGCLTQQDGFREFQSYLDKVYPDSPLAINPLLIADDVIAINGLLNYLKTR